MLFTPPVARISTWRMEDMPYQDRQIRTDLWYINLDECWHVNRPHWNIRLRFLQTTSSLSQHPLVCHCSMVSFDVTAYNKLAFVADADARFKEQLASAGLTREQLFSKLAPLFLESPSAGRYAICLIHHHYSLKDGERMVTIDHSTKPSTDTSPQIVAECWSSSGEEVEHRFTDDPTTLPPPPPVDFLAKYKSILDSHAIDVLGVCYAPDKPADGFISAESDGPGDRERVTTIIHHSARGDNSYDVMWLVTCNSNGLCVVITAGCCNGTGCKTPPSTPSTPSTPTTTTGLELWN